MRAAAVILVVAAVSGASLIAQEMKPAPKGSVRVVIPGCTRGAIFTAGPRTTDQPGNVTVPEGMHIRMNGPKKLMTEIRVHEGSRIEITGLMKTGQVVEGVGIGGGVRIAPGAPPGSGAPSPVGNQIMIDVEGWRPAIGNCPSR